MIAKFFIERPVLANVIALLIVILGIVALYTLPVAQYPDVVPPTVQVTARYPGRQRRHGAREVALPIEQRVNGVEGMIYMSSLSTSDGQYTLTVTFRIGTDGDKAQILVQNRVSSALAALPESVQKQGVQTNKRSTSILEIVALSSPDGRYDSLFLSNYATINLLDEIARLDGVGSVAVFGAGQYAIRIWLDPQKLQARGLVPQDVINAVNLQSRSTSAGQVGLPPVPQGQTFQYSINVHGKLDDVAEFEKIIVKTDTGGRITRLQDVARVELGAQQYSQTFKLDGKPAAGMAIYQLPNANALEVAKRVEARMKELAKAFPEGMAWTIPFDTTKFVESAVHDVYKTLIEAAVLVLDRHPRLPAGLARDAGAGDDRAGHHHRRLRGHGGARLHGEPVDAVRHHPRHRHRRRRRHHRRRGRGQAHRAWADAARCRHQGDGRVARADHRHHAGADGGVHAGRVPARAVRADVPPVRARHRRDRADLAPSTP